MKLHVSKEDVIKITRLTGQRLSLHQKRKKDLVELVMATLPAGSRILDVGCASGDISLELAIQGYKVHGIDFEPERLKQAEWLAKKYDQNIVFTHSSFSDMIKIEKFDGIVLGEVLEHFSNPATMLGEAEKLLNATGKIIITTPNMPSLLRRLKFFLMGIFPDNNPEHKYYFDYRRFKEVIRNTNFKIQSFQTRYSDINVFPLFLKPMETMLFGWFSKLFRKSGDTIYSVLSI